MRPELVEGIWQLTWDLPMALAMGIVWVLALASGWASLRYLRAAPDLPHKAELLWGARWIAPLGLAWFALVTVVCAFGMSRTPYAFTFMRLSYLGFVGIIPLLLFLPRQAAGWLACWHGIAVQRRRQPPDWEEWTAAADAGRQTWQGRWFIPMVLALFLGVWLYITVIDYMRVDLSAMRMGREQDLTRALEARLADIGVEEVVVVSYSRPHRVGVRLKEGTSQELREQVEERVQEALAEFGARGRWRVEVYGPGGSKGEGRDGSEQPPPRGVTDAD